MLLVILTTGSCRGESILNTAQNLLYFALLRQKYGKNISIVLLHLESAS
ncbi:hypothetical protein BegalDRAFT_0731 [Beggiatoa alba B18LD]|uniref:Uncharacterized protein n=1 Tax=Beggiatoa alba B18LD TaxID=395493 RepID=I3CDF0_9GAMM|nr:hypothetical protein BegalDRAFT_0731 [Beggiatoa alba B18LD]